MARKFLYIIAGLIALAIAATFTYRIWGAQLIRSAMVPSVPFEVPGPLPDGGYEKADLWIAHPDMGKHPAQWLPEGLPPFEKQDAAVFFVHPTSYLNRAKWNAPITDKEANDRAAQYLERQASVFNAVGDIWAPRYRQATFGAFLTDKPDAAKAIQFAYSDVLAAFDVFIAANKGKAIILAGHSQGSLHLMRLLKERVAGHDLAKQIVAAYIVGWPVSKTADLPALGLSECEKADQTGCILSWQSFAEPADTSMVTESVDTQNGLTGAPIAGTTAICTDPTKGVPGLSVAAPATIGNLAFAKDQSSATIERSATNLHCDNRGFLMLSNAPKAVGEQFVLPGNNYHVYDYSLFWSDVRTDVARRLAAYRGLQTPK